MLSHIVNVLKKWTDGNSNHNMELYDLFSDDSYSIYSKFYFFKEIYFSGKCYKFSSLMSNLG